MMNAQQRMVMTGEEENVVNNNPNRGNCRKEKQMSTWTRRVTVAALLPGSLALSIFAADSPAVGAAEPLPLGHKDFYPSAERPVMERGDMSLLFPGAKDVALEWDDRTGKNIIWKCRLPYWSNSAPIVVGKKAFVGSEPDELICVDTEKGVVLWKKSIMIDQFIPAEDREGVRKALRDGNDEAMALSCPGPTAVQKWLELMKPRTDEAMTETARRISEIRTSLKAKGLLSKTAYKGVQTGFPTPEGIALLEKHRIVDWGGKDGKKDAQKFGPFPHGSWGYHLGFTMPSPASDGKHVWYQTSLGAIACLDLDGNVVWCKRLGTVGPTTWATFVGGGSPILIKDKLYYHDHRPKVYGIVAVDKDTGKEIWRRPRDSSDNDLPPNGYSGAGGRGSSGMAPLRLEGKDFIASPGRYILDAIAGKTVGELPISSDMRRAHAIISNSLIMQGCDHLRLRMENGKVMADHVWRIGPTGSYGSATIYDGWVYNPRGIQGQPLYGYPLAGRPKNEITIYQRDQERTFAFVAAKCFINSDKQVKGDEEASPISSFQYSTAAVAEGHLFEGEDSNGMQVYKLAGKDTVAVGRNFMDLQIRSNPFFQGDRMYVRTMHYLYCIGKKP